MRTLIYRRGATPCGPHVSIFAPHAAAYPRLATAFEGKAGIDQPTDHEMRTSEDVALIFGELFYSEWRAEGLQPTDVLGALDVEPRDGLSLIARLNGLVPLLIQAYPKELIAAFGASARMVNATARAMLARVTWARVLPSIASSWSDEAATAVFSALRQQYEPLFEKKPTPAAEIVHHVLAQTQDFDKLVTRMLSERELLDPAPWWSPRFLGAA